MTQIHLLGLCGALRSGSTNRLLLQEAARLFGPATYAEASLRLPLYDGDIEAQHGIPQEVQQLAQQIIAADAVLIAGKGHETGQTIGDDVFPFDDAAQANVSVQDILNDEVLQIPEKQLLINVIEKKLTGDRSKTDPPTYADFRSRSYVNEADPNRITRAEV